MKAEILAYRAELAKESAQGKVASGESPEWIAKQLGHTTTEMLFRVYSRFVPNLTRKDGSAFERLMTSAMGGGEQQIAMDPASTLDAMEKKND